MRNFHLKFNFGKNWARFLAVIDEERIQVAANSLQDFLGIDSLRGKSFFDVGGGSVLFSLAAIRLGVKKVISIDTDPQCVNCARYLKEKYVPDSDWKIYKGSVLEENPENKYGQFDIVYSWGVLHHTGNMKKAMQNIMFVVKPGGCLYISIYNKTKTSNLWRLIKKYYCKHIFYQFIIMLYFVSYWVTAAFIKDLLRLRNPFKRYCEYKNNRGMSFYYDLLDWLGGYPYEAAKPEEIVDFYRERKFQLQRLKATKGNVCNEFLFKRID